MCEGERGTVESTVFTLNCVTINLLPGVKFNTIHSSWPGREVDVYVLEPLTLK